MRQRSAAIEAHEAKMDALRELEDSRGRLTAKRLVDAARPVGHVWHSAFEWDNAKAAEKHRIETAREIIRTWIAPRVVGETVERRQVVYVRDPRVGASEPGYVNIAKVRNSESLKRDVLIQEFQRAASALQRAYDIADLLDARDEVSHLIDKVNKLRERSESLLV